MVKIRGHEFKPITIRDSYNRRALQHMNNIIKLFKRIGLTEDDIDINVINHAMKKEQAMVSWWMLETNLFCSYNGAAKFVENIAMLEKILTHFLTLLIEDKMTPEEFMHEFSKDHDILEKRKEAREILGVDEDSLDFEAMHKNYKQLSKKHHPDMPGGDTEVFQKINIAHKILKKELA